VCCNYDNSAYAAEAGKTTAPGGSWAGAQRTNLANAYPSAAYPNPVGCPAPNPSCPNPTGLPVLPIRWVSGTWTVPNIIAPLNLYPTCAETGSCSTALYSWVGLNNEGGTNGGASAPSALFQAGIWQEIDQYNPDDICRTYAWWTWITPTHEGEVQLTGFQPFPGDTVTVFLAILWTDFAALPADASKLVNGFSAGVVGTWQEGAVTDILNEYPQSEALVINQIAYVQFENITQDEYTYFYVVVYSPDIVYAVNAIWVIEQPGQQSSTCGGSFGASTLARYGQVIFADAACGTSVSPDVYPPLGATFLDVVDSGDPLSLGPGGHVLLWNSYYGVAPYASPPETTSVGLLLYPGEVVNYVQCVYTGA